VSATTTSPDAWCTATDRGPSNLARDPAPSARPGSGAAAWSESAYAWVPLPQRPAKHATFTVVEPDAPAPVIFLIRWLPVSAT